MRRSARPTCEYRSLFESCADAPFCARSRPTNPIVRTFVLPDFTPESKNKLGYVRTGLTPPPPSPPPPDPNAPYATPAPQLEKEEEQLLHLCNERFTVPEVLFNPSTIGASPLVACFRRRC